MRQVAAVAVLSLVSFALAVPPAPSPAIDLSQPQPSKMTGTVEERNATIRKVLENPKGVHSMIILNRCPIGQALSFIGTSLKIDMGPDWDELEKQDIGRDTTIDLSLYDVTAPDALELALWQLRPTTGRVGWKIENGVLDIVPVAEFGHAKETDLQKKADAALKGKLQTAASVETKGQNVRQVISVLAQKNKLNIVVDWRELQAAGIAQETPIEVSDKDPTAEKVLQTAVDAMKLKKGKVAYEIWGGVIRVSTRERLDREKPLPEKAETAPGLP